MVDNNLHYEMFVSDQDNLSTNIYVLAKEFFLIYDIRLKIVVFMVDCLRNL